jgi:ankyrin repeat protein
MGVPEPSPIHRAASTGDVATLTALLDRNSALAKTLGWMDNTPLHEAAQHGHTEAVRLLLAHGADVHARRVHEITPLHWAGNVEIARLLLDAGAVLDAVDRFGNTPLHDAVNAGHHDVVQYLLERGSLVTALSTYSGTPLHTAAKQCDATSARLLLAAGAPINAIEPTWGTIPLHWAVRADNEPLVRLLLEHGASVEIRNKAGQTAIHYAREHGLNHLLDLLRQAAPSVAPKVPTEQDIHCTGIRLHPCRQEAVTIAQNGILSRWSLQSGTPQLDFAVQTDHSRFMGLAVSPDGALVFVAVPGNMIEVRAWDDLRVLRSITLPGAPTGAREVEVSAITFSSNGVWLAVADTVERVYLVDPVSDAAGVPVEAGERTYAVCFDPTSRLLATACSSQGGGYVRVDAISDRGDLTPSHKLERSYYQTRPDEFVDSLVHLAFSATGRWLGLFETSAIYHHYRPAGWRGDLVLFATNSGALLWEASIDEHVTADKRSLAAADYSMGFFTEVLFLDDQYVLCGATEGKLLVYRTADGSLAKSVALATTAAICSLAQDVHGAIWIRLDNGALTVIAEDILRGA